MNDPIIARSWFFASMNLIRFKDSNGYESWKEYDEKGNLIHFKDSEGNEYWREYEDENVTNSTRRSNHGT